MPSYGRRIIELAAQHPDDPAITFLTESEPERVVSWGEFGRAVERFAAFFSDRRAGPGSTIVVALPPTPELLFASFGAWLVGSCVVPMRHDLPPRERARLLDLATPTVVLGNWEDECHDIVPLSAADAIAPQSELLAAPDVVPSPAWGIASGGSTGLPKLILNLAPAQFGSGTATEDEHAMFKAIRMRLPMREHSVQLVCSPLYHTTGFTLSTSSLLRDDHLVLMERFSAERVVDAVERHRVTATTLVPTMLARIVRLSGIETRDLSSLELLLLGAASFPEWLIRRGIDLVGAEHLYIGYGASEMVGSTIIRGDEWLEHPGSVGTGLMTEIRIVSDDGAALPRGAIGEIFLKRLDVAAAPYAYVGAQPATNSNDGFTSVGDLGWLDDDGYLYISDRRADMIVTGGANVYPAEVEGAINEHLGVQDVAVIGLPDEEWGRRVHAVVVASQNSTAPSAGELSAFCRQRLAAFKVPKSFEFVDALPRSDTGKLNRSDLAAARARSNT